MFPKINVSTTGLNDLLVHTMSQNTGMVRTPPNEQMRPNINTHTHTQTTQIYKAGKGTSATYMYTVYGVCAFTINIFDASETGTQWYSHERHEWTLQHVCSL